MKTKKPSKSTICILLFIALINTHYRSHAASSSSYFSSSPSLLSGTCTLEIHHVSSKMNFDTKTNFEHHTETFLMDNFYVPPYDIRNYYVIVTSQTLLSSSSSSTAITTPTTSGDRSIATKMFPLFIDITVNAEYDTLQSSSQQQQHDDSSFDQLLCNFFSHEGDDLALYLSQTIGADGLESITNIYERSYVTMPLTPELSDGEGGVDDGAGRTTTTGSNAWSLAGAVGVVACFSLSVAGGTRRLRQKRNTNNSPKSPFFDDDEHMAIWGTPAPPHLTISSSSTTTDESINGTTASSSVKSEETFSSHTTRLMDNLLSKTNELRKTISFGSTSSSKTNERMTTKQKRQLYKSPSSYDNDELEDDSSEDDLEQQQRQNEALSIIGRSSSSSLQQAEKLLDSETRSRMALQRLSDITDADKEINDIWFPKTKKQGDDGEQQQQPADDDKKKQEQEKQQQRRRASSHDSSSSNDNNSYGANSSSDETVDTTNAAQSPLISSGVVIDNTTNRRKDPSNSNYITPDGNQSSSSSSYSLSLYPNNRHNVSLDEDGDDDDSDNQTTAMVRKNSILMETIMSTLNDYTMTTKNEDDDVFVVNKRSFESVEDDDEEDDNEDQDEDGSDDGSDDSGHAASPLSVYQKLTSTNPFDSHSVSTKNKNNNSNNNTNPFDDNKSTKSNNSYNSKNPFNNDTSNEPNNNNTNPFDNDTIPPPPPLSPPSPPTSTPKDIRRDCHAPPGKLGVVVKSVNDVSLIHSVKKNSPLEGQLFPGDRILTVNGVNAEGLSAREVTELMARFADRERRITVLSRMWDI